MWDTWLLGPLESVINQLLARDPDTPKRTQGHLGKTAEIVFLPFERGFYLTLEDRGVRLHSQYAGEPQVSIRGTPLAFTALQLRQEKLQAVSSGDIEIRGDTQFGQAIQNVFAQLSIDWEDELANVTGDVVAHQLGEWIRGSQAWLQQSQHSVTQNFSEFLQEEARLLPSREEVNDFLEEVSELRNAVERLAAKMQLLENQGTP